MPKSELVENLDLDNYKYGFVDSESHVYRTRPGLDESIVREISKHKDEPDWMLQFRLKALKVYEAKPMPTWGGDLSDLEATLDEIYFYVSLKTRQNVRGKMCQTISKPHLSASAYQKQNKKLLLE